MTPQTDKIDCHRCFSRGILDHRAAVGREHGRIIDRFGADSENVRMDVAHPPAGFAHDERGRTLARKRQVTALAIQFLYEIPTGVHLSGMETQVLFRVAGGASLPEAVIAVQGRRVRVVAVHAGQAGMPSAGPQLGVLLPVLDEATFSLDHVTCASCVTCAAKPGARIGELVAVVGTADVPGAGAVARFAPNARFLPGPGNALAVLLKNGQVRILRPRARGMTDETRVIVRLSLGLCGVVRHEAGHRPVVREREVPLRVHTRHTGLKDKAILIDEQGPSQVSADHV